MSDDLTMSRGVGRLQSHEKLLEEKMDDDSFEERSRYVENEDQNSVLSMTFDGADLEDIQLLDSSTRSQFLAKLGEYMKKPIDSLESGKSVARDVVDMAGERYPNSANIFQGILNGAIEGLDDVNRNIGWGMDEKRDGVILVQAVVKQIEEAIKLDLDHGANDPKIALKGILAGGKNESSNSILSEDEGGVAVDVDLRNSKPGVEIQTQNSQAPQKEGVFDWFKKKLKLGED